MPVVGTLTVDLVANTATFTADLGKAGNSLDDLGKSADTAGKAVDYSMTEARHGVMMLGEEFGIHLPRGITSFIASIGPIGAAMEAAFPFLAIAVGATLLLEHLSKLHEAAEKLTESQAAFGVTTLNVFDSLDNKLLEAGIKADELRGDHLAALQAQLELIDHQSMHELSQEFNTIAKAADALFAQLKASWYQFGAGSAGAQHALTSFKNQYDSLVAQGKDPEASNLLSGTLASAQKYLAIQQQLRENPAKFNEAALAYARTSKTAVDSTEKAYQAQVALVDALQAQVTVEEKVAALKKAQDDAAGAGADSKIGADGDKRFREQAQEAKQAADAAQQAWDLAFKEAVSRLQQNEKEKIDATRQGSNERLAAINAAIKEENSKGLQETGFYKGLLTERVNITRQMAEEQQRIEAGLASETLKQSLAMAKLKEAAEAQEAKHTLAMHQGTAKQVMEAEIKAANDAAKAENQALDQEIASLNKHDANYLVQLQQFENKKKQIIQQNENQVIKIREQAEEKQYQDIKRAEERVASVIAQNVAKGIVEGKNLAKGFEDMGKQMLEAATENTLKMILLGDMKQAKDAAHAAASAFKWVMQDVPFPVNAVLAPAAAAAAFAGVMAFEQGGDIPGSGPQRAIVHGGESVVTKALKDRVEESEGRGKGKSGGVTIVQNIHTKDADGFKQSQSQLHSKAFHAANVASKRNR